MTDIYYCPADGCDYRGTFQSVGAHYAGSQGENHTGGWEVVKAELNGSGESGESDTTEVSDESAGSGDSRASEGGEGLSIPENENGVTNDSAASSSDGSDCPECGGSLRSLDGGEELVLESGDRAIAESGDSLCGECGALVESNGEVLH